MSNAIEKAKNLLIKDGAKVIRIDLYGDVLVIVVDLLSGPQIKRFSDVGNKLNMFEDSEIEVKEKGIIFSAALAA